MLQDTVLYIRISTRNITLAAHRDGKVTTYVHRLNHRVSFTLNLREALAAASSVIGDNVQEARIYYSTPATVVPISEFTEAEAKQHYEASFRHDGTERVLFDTLPKRDTVLVYGISETVCHKLEETFPKVSFSNATTPILQQGTPAADVIATHTIQIYVHETMTETIVWEGRKFLALNSFTTKHPDDVAFFVLGMAEALGILPADTHFIVAGEKRKVSQTTESLSKFARDVEALHEEDGALPYDLTAALALSKN